MSPPTALSRFSLSLIAIAAAASTHAQVPQAERDALVEIYESTAGHQWREDDGWLGGQGTECNWHGVDCGVVDGELRVQSIDLSFNELQGELPPSLAALSRLGALRLKSNRLSGEAPNDLWELENLGSLDISDNRFSGSIPDTLLELSGFVLDLSENQFSGYRVSEGEFASGNVGELLLAGNSMESLPPPEWRRDLSLETLDLARNALAGTLDISALPATLKELNLSGNDLTILTGLETADRRTLDVLDLSDNRITAWPDGLGSLMVERLFLSNNELSGDLPDWLSGLPLTDLDLSGNELSDDLPASLSDLQLAALDLSDNQFTGSIEPALAALSEDGHGPVWLHVGNNRFAGALPESFDPDRFNSESDWNNQFRRIERFGLRGLDLCWNDFELDADALEAINRIQRGGDVESCIGRTRQPIDPSLSGSWYTPDRSGEGITQMVLNNGRVLTYWFTFGTGPSLQNQMWGVSVGDPGERQRMDIPIGGRFSTGFSQSAGRLSLYRVWQRQSYLGGDSAHFAYDSAGGAICVTGFCSWDFHTGRYDQQRLTQLAGTRCDNRSSFQRFSGAWYDPDRSGEGLIVEVLPDDRVVAYWFTYPPDESTNQAWMIGQGEFDDSDVIVDPPPEFPNRAELDMYQPQGTAFGQNFDSDEIELVEWGKLYLQFSESGDGRIVWNSELEAYGSGDYSIEPLAKPKLAHCD